MAFIRIMGIDMGDVRIGIALSDPLGMTAQGIESYTRVSEKSDIAHIREFCEKNGVTKIVMGFPKNMNGTIGPMAEKIQAFSEKLKKTVKAELVFEDERLTTVMAERTLLEADMSWQKRRKIVDKIAAVNILQGYLERNYKTY